MNPKLLEEVIKALPDYDFSNRRLICKFIGMEREIDEEEYKKNHTAIILETIEKITKYASLEQLNQLIVELPMNSVYEKAVIKDKGLDYAEYCLKNRSTLALTASMIISAISDMNTPDFTEKCLSRAEELELGNNTKIDLICSVKDTDYIDRCIDRWSSIGLDKEDILDIIAYTKDNEYIKKWVQKGKNFGFNSVDLMRLIISTKDDEYIEQCILQKEKIGLDNNAEVALIAEQIPFREILNAGYSKKEEYTQVHKELKKWIDVGYEKGLEPIDIAGIINDGVNSSYADDCLYNKAEEYKFDSRTIAYFLNRIIISDCHMYLLEEENRKRLNDMDMLIVVLTQMQAMGQHFFDFSSFINDLDKDAMHVKNCITDSKYLEEYLESQNDNHTAKIMLPKEMTIGIEIECLGGFSYILKERGTLYNWNCKSDSSIMDGKIDEEDLEITSPILTGDTENTTNSIRNMCDLLETMGQRTNETCGGHIHIGGNYLTSTESWKNLMELYINCEKILYLIGNEEGETPREGVIDSAGPASNELEYDIDTGELEIKDVEDLRKFKLRISETDRYKGINFTNLGKKRNHGTVEFRIPNGTINPDTWINNINLFGGLIKAAEDIHHIQEKEESGRTEKESEILQKFENIKSGELDEFGKLEILLDIVMPDEIRNVYIERYETNKKLLHKNQFVEETITKRSKTKAKGFKLKKENVGKKVIGGNERVEAKEYQKASSELRNSLVRDAEYSK